MPRIKTVAAGRSGAHPLGKVPYSHSGLWPNITVAFSALCVRLWQLLDGLVSNVIMPSHRKMGCAAGPSALLSGGFPASTSGCGQWFGKPSNFVCIGAVPYGAHHGKGEHDQCCVAVPSMPGSGFVMIEAEFVLGSFEAVLDAPALAFHADQRGHRGHWGALRWGTKWRRRRVRRRRRDGG